MSKKFSENYIDKAHKATIYNEKDIMDSNVCTCFYCGYQFNPKTEEDLEWMDEKSPKGKTLVCPMCLIDCVIGDASGFPVTDSEFIMACTEEWFGGISRISDGKPIEKLPRYVIEVE
ncbi:MAG: hypothetical protein JEY71_07690 [Sphaerochaeta sp.]|nr:hypothetical protein [Sphaerochaeta sp.]